MESILTEQAIKSGQEKMEVPRQGSSNSLEGIHQQVEKAAGNISSELKDLARNNPNIDLSDEENEMKRLKDELDETKASTTPTVPEKSTPTVSKEIEEDHHPEIVEGGKATRRLELLGIKEALSEGGKRREFFSELTNEQYKKIFGYINSITRGQPIEYDYQDGQLPMEATPPLKDKERLMDLTFEAVKNILKNEDLDNNQALRIAGLTLAGAVNYIHPYENGNGRVGRVVHYLAEFGNQRGDKVFQDELYSIIGKLPMYDTDRAYALDDTPPPELGIELGQYVAKNYNTKDKREFASKKVEVFLDMMQGRLELPITKEVPMRNNASYTKGRTPPIERIQPGSIDGLELYVKNYLYQSTIPNRSPSAIPEGANRVSAERKKAQETFSLPMDFV